MIQNNKARKSQKLNTKPQLLSRFWYQIKSNTLWFCDTTSLHGFQYISAKHSSIFTRLLFACVSCCGVVFCCYLIGLQLLEQQQQSILTTVTSTAYPVRKIRFPAVTICNLNIVYKDNIMNIMNVVKSQGINNNVFMDIVSNLSTLITNDNLGEMKDSEEVFDALEAGGYTVDKLMAELAHPCESMIKKCFWKSDEVPCKNVIDFVRTSEGYCCSFNYHGTRETASKIHDPRNFRYQYIDGTGPTLALRLVLDIEKEQHVSSIRPFLGFHVLVQDGTHYPDMDLIANTLLASQELTISVTPRIYISSDNIKQMDFQRRRCLFEDEGNLQSSSMYSFKTCIIECKAKAIFQYCKCVPYYYPIQKQPKRFCTLQDAACLRTNIHKYSVMAFTDAFLKAKELQPIRDRIENIVRCSCYPQCNQRMFDFYTNVAPVRYKAAFNGKNISIVNVHYNVVGCVKTDRDVYFTWYRVLASIGGLFGLCLGGSVISILECFYFVARFGNNSKNIEPKMLKKEERGSNCGKQPVEILNHH